MDTFQMRSETGAQATQFSNFGLPRHRVVITAPWAFLLVWAERRQQRLALMRLSDTMLRDIGISALDVSRECRKPCWRA